MSWLEALRIAVRGMLGLKIRAALSMLGIIFGVASVVAVISVSEGARSEFMKQLAAMGADNVMVQAREFGGDQEKVKAARKVSKGLTVAEADFLASQLRVVSMHAPVKVLDVNVRSGTRKVNCPVVGTRPEFLAVKQFRLREGRFLTEDDGDRHVRVCVIEEALCEELFPFEKALGKNIFIDHEPYRVVGVMRSKETTEKKYEVVDIGELNRTIYIPLSCSLDRTPRRNLAAEIDEVIFQISDPDGSPDGSPPPTMLNDSARLIRAFYLRAHSMVGVQPEDRDFDVTIALDLVRQRQKSEEIFAWTLLIFAGISLVVGGIGIMNIMLANVTERRREIGIRRAVGADQLDILKQFLFEALAICLLGGFLGLFAGVVFTWWVAALTGWKTILSAWAILVAMAFSLADGVAFGTYPAYRAARLDPIEALRYE